MGYKTIHIINHLFNIHFVFIIQSASFVAEEKRLTYCYSEVDKLPPFRKLKSTYPYLKK